MSRQNPHPHFFHCRNVEKGRGAAVICTREAVIVWRDKDKIALGWCSDRLARTPEEAKACAERLRSRALRQLETAAALADAAERMAGPLNLGLA